jgi:hypothetical protein
LRVCERNTTGIKKQIVKSIIIISFVFTLSVVGCKDQPTDSGNSLEQISFTTNSNSYTEHDTIALSLKNNSSSDIIIGLRCGIYLEMFYQRKANQEWGDSLGFSYMSFRCLTELDTILMKNSFAHLLPATMLDSTGTFRLVIDVHIPQTDTSLMVISNQFQIQ